MLLAVDPSNGMQALQAAERLGFRQKIGWGGSPTLFLDLVLANTDLAAKTGLYSSSPFIPPIREFEHLPAVREYLSGIRAYVDERNLTNPVVELGWIAAALTVRVLQDAGRCPTRNLVLAAAERITAWQAAGLTLPLTYRPHGQGAGHDGNSWSMIVQAVPRGKHGCARAIGCWRWIKAPTPNGWYQDPLLARGSP